MSECLGAIDKCSEPFGRSVPQSPGMEFGRRGGVVLEEGEIKQGPIHSFQGKSKQLLKVFLSLLPRSLSKDFDLKSTAYSI